MPLYELLIIANRAAMPQLSATRSLLATTSSLVLANGGVVRNIDYWGARNLPQKMKRGGVASSTGEYVTMRFDANPPTVKALNERLRLDPRVLRWTTLKVGTKFDEVTAPAEDMTVRYERRDFRPLRQEETSESQTTS
ncbi:hypothetical protein T439DRAFT_320812 [Meredithblackwellia eburnea MCA 4105]